MPPFQPQVVGQQRPGGRPGWHCGAADPAARHDGHRSRVQTSDSVHVVGRRAARDPAQLHPRRDLRRTPRAYLQRERDINQMQPGTIQANPGVNIAALRPVQGLRPDPPVGELGLLEVQQPAGQRASDDTRTASSSASPTRSATQRTTPATSATFSSTPTTTRASGATRASTAATCSTSRTSTICRSTGSRQA